MEIAIVQIIASAIGYFSARGIDSIIGKYLAMIQIAFEKAASKSARDEYRARMDAIVSKMPGKSKEWDEWRKGRQWPS